MPSHKSTQNDIEDAADKVKIKLWMRVVLSILLVIVLFLIAIVLIVNVNNGRAGTRGIHELSKLPFSSNQFVLPLKSDVKGTEYKSGTLLIINSKVKPVNGDTVLAENVLAERIDDAIQRKYQIGIVGDENENIYVLSIPSYDNQDVDVDKENVLGKIENSIGGLGYIYSRMLGVSGIMMFAVIPFLLWILVFFIMNYTTLSSKHKKDSSGIKVVSAQTIRSTTTPLSKIYGNSGKADEATNNENDSDNDTKVFVPQVEHLEQGQERSIIVHKDDDIPLVNIAAINDKPRAVIEKIEKANNDAVIQDIKVNNERLSEMDNQSKNKTTGGSDIDLSTTQEFVIETSADGKPIDPSAIQDSEVVVVENNEVVEEENQQKSRKKALSADEILAIYRRDGKLEWADDNNIELNKVSDSNHADSSKKKDINLETVARLYYDNEIDNYDI